VVGCVKELSPRKVTHLSTILTLGSLTSAFLDASKIFHKEPKKEDIERDLLLLPFVFELNDVFTFMYQCFENDHNYFS
jgi:hypothetical protein